jgi:hypothetical protein
LVAAIASARQARKSCFEARQTSDKTKRIASSYWDAAANSFRKSTSNRGTALPGLSRKAALNQRFPVGPQDCASPLDSETGMPFTSKNRVPAGKDPGRVTASAEASMTPPAGVAVHPPALQAHPLGSPQALQCRCRDPAVLHSPQCGRQSPSLASRGQGRPIQGVDGHVRQVAFNPGSIFALLLVRQIVDDCP